MSNEDHSSTWATYQAAWGDVSDPKRQDLLNKSVSDDVVYTDPSGQASNRGELITFIEEFKQSMPGATFRNHKLIGHHAQTMAEWMLYDANGAELVPGSSWARYGEDGRLTNVSGFFEAPNNPG